MKIIFLDIDGVLNSIDSMLSLHGCNESKLDHVSVMLLKRLCEQTDAKIVISSTWRRSRATKDFIEMFAKHHNWFDAPVISRTPVLNTERGHEIQEWLDSHPEVPNFVILDDDSDMLDSQLDNFVHVSNVNGFRSKHFCKALRIFGQPDERLEKQVNFVRKSTKGE